MRAVAAASPVLLGMLLGGCFTDRERPWPVEPEQEVQLSAELLAPPTGSVAATGDTLTVTVRGRELEVDGLEGVGFVVRQVTTGMPMLDSAAVKFAPRADSTHDFRFIVPQHLTTNTQLDVYGIAFGPGLRTELSRPVYLTAVKCTDGVCR